MLSCTVIEYLQKSKNHPEAVNAKHSLGKGRPREARRHKWEWRSPRLVRLFARFLYITIHLLLLDDGIINSNKRSALMKRSGIYPFGLHT